MAGTDSIYGYHDPDASVNAILVVDYDIKTTNNFFFQELLKRTPYLDGLYEPDLTEDGLLLEGSEAGKIKLSKIPSGVFVQKHRAFSSGETEFNLPLNDGNYYVYLSVMYGTEKKTYVEDEATPEHTFKVPKMDMTFQSTENESHGVRIGRITVASGTFSVVDNQRQEARIDAGQLGGTFPVDQLDISNKFNPVHFENDAEGLISLKSQLSKDALIGHVKKYGNTGVEVFGKYEDGVERYNQIAIQNNSQKFGEGNISLGVTGIGGILGGAAQNDFQDSRALIMAVIQYDTYGNEQNRGYGFYRQPQAKIASAATDGNSDTVFTLTGNSGFSFNPLAMFYIRDNTNNIGEFVFGVSRDALTITIKGSLKNSYIYTNDITIEQVNNFRLFNKGTGSEEFGGNTAYTGVYVSFDSTPVLVEDYLTESQQFLEKKLEDVYFGNSIAETGFALIRDVKPAGVDGGAVTANTWIQRDLNDLDTELTSISLNTNRISLEPGTYKLKATCPSRMVLFNRARVFNYTHGTTLKTDNNKEMISDTGYCNYTNAVTEKVHISGQFTVTETTEIQIEHIASGSYARGFCFGNNFSISEVYTVVEIEKIA